MVHSHTIVPTPKAMKGKILRTFVAQASNSAKVYPSCGLLCPYPPPPLHKHAESQENDG